MSSKIQKKVSINYLICFAAITNWLLYSSIVNYPFESVVIDSSGFIEKALFALSFLALLAATIGYFISFYRSPRINILFIVVGLMDVFFIIGGIVPKCLFNDTTALKYVFIAIIILKLSLLICENVRARRTGYYS